MSQVPVSPDDVEHAARRIAALVRRTPVIEDAGLLLKLELLQHAGSFKPRGAANRVLAGRERGEVPEAGVVTASGGNHGAALAYVGRALQIPTEVFVPSTSPEFKRATITAFGARVHLVQGYYDDARVAAEAHQRSTGALMVHAFDHTDTVAGQATIARELDVQVGGYDTLVVAAGGGGLVAGQAAWVRDRVRVVAVEPESTDCVGAALRAGHPVDVEVSGLAADSLGARRVGEVPWAVLRHYLDQAVTVSDEAIRQAQRELWISMRLVVEPGGAAALAAIRSGAYRPEPGERVVVVICGSNVDPVTLTRPATIRSS
jgi:threonine dehydratase